MVSVAEAPAQPLGPFDRIVVSFVAQVEHLGRLVRTPEQGPVAGPLPVVEGFVEVAGAQVDGGGPADAAGAGAVAAVQVGLYEGDDGREAFIGVALIVVAEAAPPAVRLRFGVRRRLGQVVVVVVVVVLMLVVAVLEKG